VILPWNGGGEKGKIPGEGGTGKMVAGQEQRVTGTTDRLKTLGRVTSINTGKGKKKEEENRVEYWSTGKAVYSTLEEA